MLRIVTKNLIEALLKLSVDFNSLNGNGQTHLLWVTQHDFALVTAKFLQRFGADVVGGCAIGGAPTIDCRDLSYLPCSSKGKVKSASTQTSGGVIGREAYRKEVIERARVEQCI